MTLSPSLISDYMEFLIGWPHHHLLWLRCAAKVLCSVLSTLMRVALLSSSIRGPPEVLFVWLHLHRYWWILTLLGHLITSLTLVTMSLSLLQHTVLQRLLLGGFIIFTLGGGLQSLGTLVAEPLSFPFTWFSSLGVCGCPGYLFIAFAWCLIPPKSS